MDGVAAIGCGGAETGRTGAGGAAGASTATADVSREISASSGERAPGCSETAMNRDNTSSAAVSDAALVCARNSGDSALVGLLLLQAATTSATAWCNSSELRCMRSRLSRSARTTACSTALASLDIAKSARFERKPPKISFWECCSPPSTALPYPCAQLNSY